MVSAHSKNELFSKKHQATRGGGEDLRSGVRKRGAEPTAASQARGGINREMGQGPCLASREKVTGEEPRGEAPAKERKRKEMAASRPREPTAMGGFMPESGHCTAAGSCLEPPGRGSKTEERGGADDTATYDFFRMRYHQEDSRMKRVVQEESRTKSPE
jgi:hypothetical protein